MRKAVLSALLLCTMPGAAYAAGPEVPLVNGWMVTPFLALLLAIAVAPFINRPWWDRYYPHVSLGLGFVVLAYYLMYLDYRRMVEVGVDYISFICLIGSLFVAAGGIYLHTERHATPLMNCMLLGVGALVSNVVGTTGASMLLIRPFIRVNKQRIRGFHVVFFIFVVSNIGGALTPVGDPPLFLGYLNGVPFSWTLVNLWRIWLVALGLVLLAFLATDTWSYRKWVETSHREVRGTRFHVVGTQNFFFLAIILLAVFAASPIRELIMVAAASAAHRFARKDALRANEFTFVPIKEVAILFAGIFATMVPALDWLELNAARLGIRSPGQFYWGSGLLSSFLDNAPTYLNFLSAALGLHELTLGNLDHMHTFISQHGRFLQAISVGSVFFGANTYIGNGPNFMVKSIAEHAGVDCPSFFGYIARYSLPILVPVFAVVWFIFFR